MTLGNDVPCVAAVESGEEVEDGTDYVCDFEFILSAEVL